MITTFNLFENWTNKYDLPSDNIRYYYISKELNNTPSEDIVNIFKLTDTWDGYDDLLFVRNRKTYIDYYEGFVDACWIALYNKPEYQGLSKADAVKKLVEDRMTKIITDLNLIIDYYIFEDSILYIKIIINK